MASRFRQIVEARRGRFIGTARYREFEIDIPRDMVIADLMTEASNLYLALYAEVDLMAVPLTTETQTFYTHILGASPHPMVVGAIVQETQSLYTPLYAATPVQLTAGLISETDTTYTPEYGEVTLLAVPAMVTETVAAYQPSYVASPHPMTVPVINETNWAYPSQYVASQSLMTIVAMMTESEAAYQPTYAEVDLMAVGNMITDAGTVYAPTATITANTMAVAAMMTQTETVYAPTVGSVTQLTVAAMMTETNTMYAPTVTAGAAVTHPDYFYYTRNNFTPGDVQIRRITDAGTDSILISSVETQFTDDQDLVAAIQYMPGPNLFLIALREHTQSTDGPRSFLMTTDGTVRQGTVHNLDVGEISGLSAYDYDPDTARLVVGSTTNALQEHYFGSRRRSRYGGSIGGDEILGMAIDVANDRVIFCDSLANSGLQATALNNTSIQSPTSFAADGFSYTAICANWAAVNGDASTGRLWAFDSENDTFHIFNEAGTELSTLDISSLGAFSVGQMRYDPVNDNVYFLRTNGGSEAIWFFPATEDPVVGDVESLVTLQSGAARFDIFNNSEYVAIGSDPSGVTSLRLWLKAEDCLNHSDVACSNGDTIKTWPDQSGNGYDATQTNSALAPTWNSADGNLNSLPSVDFGTVSNAYHLRLADDSLFGTWGSQKWTIFVVGQKDDTSANTVFWCGDHNGGEGFEILIDSTVDVLYRTGSANTTVGGIAVDNGATSALLAVWFLDKTNSQVITHEIMDDTYQTSYLGPATAISSLSTWPTASINQCIGLEPRVDLPSTDTANMYNRWEGAIAEIIVYNKELSAAEMETVMNYLHDKYGNTFGVY